MEVIDVIYDRYGRPLVRLFKNGNFVSFHGNHIGFLSKGSIVYNYSGKHIGWYEGGILRDITGNCVGYGEYVVELIKPILPIKQIKPIAHITKIPPIRPIPNIPNIKPIKTFIWSDIELSHFFFQ